MYAEHGDWVWTISGVTEFTYRAWREGARRERERIQKELLNNGVLVSGPNAE